MNFSRSRTMSEAMDSTPLALLHGWGMHRQLLAPLARQFDGERDTILLDLPGHGGRREDLSDLSSWLVPLAQQLEGSGAPVDLLGWSLGGMLGLALADRCPEMVRRLILVDTTPKFVCGEGWEHGLPRGQVRVLARQLKRDMIGTMKSFAALMTPLEDDGDPVWQAWSKECSHPEHLPDLQGALAGLALLQELDLRPRLAAIKAPVLVIHGERDRVTPVPAGKYLAEQLPDVVWHMVPQAGHAPFYPSFDGLASVVKEFCR